MWAATEEHCKVPPIWAATEERVVYLFEHERVEYMFKSTSAWVVWIIGLLFGLTLLLIITGCDSLRFAPSEAIKQSSELTHQLARKINVDGTDPGSPASEKVVDGTATSLTYTGRPKVAPNPDDFNTINNQAGNDAAERPDVEGTIDTALEIGLGIAGLIGGVGGFKLTQSLRKVYGKAKAFNEVIQQIDQIKKVTTIGDSMKIRGVLKTQTPKTQKQVAQVRIDEKTQYIRVPKGEIQ